MHPNRKWRGIKNTDNFWLKNSAYLELNLCLYAILYKKLAYETVRQESCIMFSVVAI